MILDRILDDESSCRNITSTPNTISDLLNNYNNIILLSNNKAQPTRTIIMSSTDSSNSATSAPRSPTNATTSNGKKQHQHQQQQHLLRQAPPVLLVSPSLNKRKLGLSGQRMPPELSQRNLAVANNCKMSEQTTKTSNDSQLQPQKTYQQFRRTSNAVTYDIINSIIGEAESVTAAAAATSTATEKATAAAAATVATTTTPRSGSCIASDNNNHNNNKKEKEKETSSKNKPLTSITATKNSAMAWSRPNNKSKNRTNCINNKLAIASESSVTRRTRAGSNSSTSSTNTTTSSSISTKNQIQQQTRRLNAPVDSLAAGTTINTSTSDESDDDSIALFDLTKKDDEAKIHHTSTTNTSIVYNNYDNTTTKVPIDLQSASLSPKLQRQQQQQQKQQQQQPQSQSQPQSHSHSQSRQQSQDETQIYMSVAGSPLIHQLSVSNSIPSTSNKLLQTRGHERQQEQQISLSSSLSSRALSDSQFKSSAILPQQPPVFQSHQERTQQKGQEQHSQHKNERVAATRTTAPRHMKNHQPQINSNLDHVGSSTISSVKTKELRPPRASENASLVSSVSSTSNAQTRNSNNALASATLLLSSAQDMISSSIRSAFLSSITSNDGNQKNDTKHLNNSISNRHYTDNLSSSEGAISARRREFLQQQRREEQQKHKPLGNDTGDIGIDVVDLIEKKRAELRNRSKDLSDVGDWREKAYRSSSTSSSMSDLDELKATKIAVEAIATMSDPIKAKAAAAAAAGKANSNSNVSGGASLTTSINNSKIHWRRRESTARHSLQNSLGQIQYDGMAEIADLDDKNDSDDESDNENDCMHEETPRTSNRERVSIVSVAPLLLHEDCVEDCSISKQQDQSDSTDEEYVSSPSKIPSKASMQVSIEKQNISFTPNTGKAMSINKESILQFSPDILGVSDGLKRLNQQSYVSGLKYLNRNNDEHLETRSTDSDSTVDFGKDFLDTSLDTFQLGNRSEPSVSSMDDVLDLIRSMSPTSTTSVSKTQEGKKTEQNSLDFTNLLEETVGADRPEPSSKDISTSTIVESFFAERHPVTTRTQSSLVQLPAGSEKAKLLMRATSSPVVGKKQAINVSSIPSRSSLLPIGGGGKNLNVKFHPDTVLDDGSSERRSKFFGKRKNAGSRRSVPSIVPSSTQRVASKQQTSQTRPSPASVTATVLDKPPGRPRRIGSITGTTPDGSLLLQLHKSQSLPTLIKKRSKIPTSDEWNSIEEHLTEKGIPLQDRPPGRPNRRGSMMGDDGSVLLLCKTQSMPTLITTKLEIATESRIDQPISSLGNSNSSNISTDYDISDTTTLTEMKDLQYRDGSDDHYYDKEGVKKSNFGDEEILVEKLVTTQDVPPTRPHRLRSITGATPDGSLHKLQKSQSMSILRTDHHRHRPITIEDSFVRSIKSAGIINTTIHEVPNNRSRRRNLCDEDEIDEMVMDEWNSMHEGEREENTTVTVQDRPPNRPHRLRSITGASTDGSLHKLQKSLSMSTLTTYPNTQDSVNPYEEPGSLVRSIKSAGIINTTSVKHRKQLLSASSDDDAYTAVKSLVDWHSIEHQTMEKVTKSRSRLDLGRRKRQTAKEQFLQQIAAFEEKSTTCTSNPMCQQQKQQQRTQLEENVATEQNVISENSVEQERDIDDHSVIIPLELSITDTDTGTSVPPKKQSLPPMNTESTMGLNQASAPSARQNIPPIPAWHTAVQDVDSHDARVLHQKYLTLAGSKSSTLFLNAEPEVEESNHVKVYGHSSEIQAESAPPSVSTENPSRIAIKKALRERDRPWTERSASFDSIEELDIDPLEDLPEELMSHLYDANVEPGNDISLENERVTNPEPKNDVIVESVVVEDPCGAVLVLASLSVDDHKRPQSGDRSDEAQTVETRSNVIEANIETLSQPEPRAHSEDENEFDEELDIVPEMVTSFLQQQRDDLGPATAGLDSQDELDPLDKFYGSAVFETRGVMPQEESLQVASSTDSDPDGPDDNDDKDRDLNDIIHARSPTGLVDSTDNILDIVDGITDPSQITQTGNQSLVQEFEENFGDLPPKFLTDIAITERKGPHMESMISSTNQIVAQTDRFNSEDDSSSSSVFTANRCDEDENGDDQVRKEAQEISSSKRIKISDGDRDVQRLKNESALHEEKNPLGLGSTSSLNINDSCSSNDAAMAGGLSPHGHKRLELSSVSEKSDDSPRSNPSRLAGGTSSTNRLRGWISLVKLRSNSSSSMNSKGSEPDPTSSLTINEMSADFNASSNNGTSSVKSSYLAPKAFKSFRLPGKSK